MITVATPKLVNRGFILLHPTINVSVELIYEGAVSRQIGN